MTDTGFCLSRRDLLRALAATGVTTIAAGVLVACGDTEETAAGTTGATATTTAGGNAGTDVDSSPAAEPGTSAESSTGAGGAATTGVALADVPVGEARVVDVDGRRVVVAQPTEGAVVAYSAVCTHQQVNVESAGGLLLRCPQHGSEFDATDGTATKGPARAPLPAITAAVEGDRIVFS